MQVLNLTRLPRASKISYFSDRLLGSLVGRGATKGVFVTTSKFSGEAIEFAHHLSQRVILIDGNKMADLMIEYGIGCTIKTTMELKQVDENFFDEEE
jgi:restriction system protein